MATKNTPVTSAKPAMPSEPAASNPEASSLAKARSNPWMISTIVLGVLLVGFVVFSLSGGGITGNVVGSSSVAQNVLDYLNAQVGGGVTLESVSQESGFYKVNVNYNGQVLPIYATKDGKNLISDLIPLDGSAGSANTGTTTGSAVEIDSSDLVDAPMLGSKDAKVVVVGFSDLQCPFCAKFYSEAYKQLKTEYIDTGKIAFYFKDFPLSFHQNAGKAAEAAHCAAEQGKFWEMHDKMFENNNYLNSASTSDALASYKKWAKELGLKSATFDSCVDSGKYAQAVQDSESLGQSLGVTGTPTFFVNGKSLVGAQPFSAFKQVIDAALADSSA